MKNSVVSIGMLSVTLIAAWSGASPSLAQDSSGSLKKFRGDWACSFESSVGFAGPVAGVALLRFDRSGNITGEETIVSADPFVEIHSTFDGTLALLANGSIRGDVNLQISVPTGVPDQIGSILCIGMDTQGDRFREIRCLDVADEPGDEDIVGLLMCKRR